MASINSKDVLVAKIYPSFCKRIIPSRISGLCFRTRTNPLAGGNTVFTFCPPIMYIYRYHYLTDRLTMRPRDLQLHSSNKRVSGLTKTHLNGRLRLRIRGVEEVFRLSGIINLFRLLSWVAYVRACCCRVRLDAARRFKFQPLFACAHA